LVVELDEVEGLQMTFEIGSFKEAQLEVSSAGRLFQMAGTVCQ